MIEKEGGTALPFVADVVDEAQCRAIVDEALARFGRLDLLDNNVGIGGRGSVVDTAVADWRRIMQVNVDSMFLVSRFAIPAMIDTAGGGAIVNVSSISALRPRGLTAYSTSKGAVIALTRAMAVDHGREGIRVNCVAPGPVFTPMVYGRGMTEGVRQILVLKIDRHIPQIRRGPPQHFVHALLLQRLRRRAIDLEDRDMRQQFLASIR
jgi:NAD(P)-dependent dehydrogenase (short-subunit alcohol dehydrogenase family)